MNYSTISLIESHDQDHLDDSLMNLINTKTIIENSILSHNFGGQRGTFNI